MLNPQNKPRVHDFAIIWDEDHNERGIPVVEGLLMAGLLAPVLFIGERKGSLTVLVDGGLLGNASVNFDAYQKQVEAVCENNSGVDCWPTEVVAVEGTSSGLHATGLGGLVNDRDERVLAYLRAIDVL